MKYTKLGNSNLNVSRVCMGCMGFGDPQNGMHTWTLPEKESIEIIKNGLENGINFYDTAIGYQNGTSEQYVGKAIRENAEREDVVVATKFLPRSEEEIANNVSGQEHIHNFVNKSLENLGLDYCYSLGYNAFMLIQYGYNGYLSKISNLSSPASEWVAGGMPITKMMNIERRHGEDKPVIKKALVELDGAPFKFFEAHREEWAENTCFVYPGAIQYYGPTEVCDATTITLALEQAK